MTCKDCLHHKACKNIAYEYAGEDAASAYDEDNCCKLFAEICANFSDKSKWVHLPCKVGDTVYYITGIRRTLIKPAIIKEMILDTSGIKELFVSTDSCEFENSFDIFYLTREETEKALAGKEKE